MPLDTVTVRFDLPFLTRKPNILTPFLSNLSSFTKSCPSNKPHSEIRYHMIHREESPVFKIVKSLANDQYK